MFGIAKENLSPNYEFLLVQDWMEIKLLHYSKMKGEESVLPSALLEDAFIHSTICSALIIKHGRFCARQLDDRQD